MQTLKIMLLGPAGSGKTAILVSLYHRLQIQDQDIGFFLNTDLSQQRRLNGVYAQIASSMEEWPDATQSSKFEEWPFTCCIKSDNKVYKSFEFFYVDYSGERLTNVHYKGSKELEIVLSEVKSYLGLLDGRKILEFMRGEQGNDWLVDEFVHIDLPQQLAIMHRDMKPIHFVITKWDLLENKYTLSQIRDQLLSIPEFGDFVRTHMKHYPVRLIPVSSVGSNFADLQEDGTMQKRVGTYPRPFQVEMALACAFLDIFYAQLVEFDQEYTAKKGFFPIGKPRTSILKAIELGTKRSVHSLARNFSEIRKIFNLDEKTCEEILDFFIEERALLNLDPLKRREEAERRAVELNKLQQHSLSAVKDERTAIKHTIDSFMALQARLEKQFPESLLTGPVEL